MARRSRRAYELVGFDSISSYVSALRSTPDNLRKRPLQVRRFDEQQADAKEAAQVEMKRVLGAFQLICMGIGMMLGAGVFVTTGFVAVTLAGPAVILSYAAAGLSALLSSLCYAEFASSIPISGGAYAYVAAVFGEYPAFIVVANLIFEYILANAAAVRGFTPYFGHLINQPAQRFITLAGGYELDWFALGWCLLFMVLLILGTRESSGFNAAVTIVHVALVAFIIIAGFVKANPANATPFFPFGVRGIFDGASLVYFSYIGFDAVATAAEEVKNPARDIPIGILGAVGITTLCYMLMTAALVLMVPIGSMDVNAAFASAFGSVGMEWARAIVAAGALLGILASTLVGMFAQARIVAAVARQHLLPPVLARVHKRFGTPHISTLLTGLATASIALVTDFAELADLISISTLFAFLVVALALIWSRYYEPGESDCTQGLRVGVHLFLLVGASIAFTVVYQMMPPGLGGKLGLIFSGVGTLFVTASLDITTRQAAAPRPYNVPLFPYLPALSVVVNVFLLGQLKHAAYVRFGWWTIAVTGVYLLFSMPAAAYRELRASNLPKALSFTTKPGLELQLPEQLKEASPLEQTGEDGAQRCKSTRADVALHVQK